MSTPHAAPERLGAEEPADGAPAPFGYGYGERPRPEGVPPWVGAVLLAVALVAFGVFFAVRWQREQAIRADEAAARADASAQATVDAARPAAGPTAQATVAPNVPVMHVERVEPVDSPAYKEITDAARHYWEVYGDALYTLDTSHLSEVATGEELDAMLAKVEELRTRNRILELRMYHDTFVYNATDSEAHLNDKSVDHSVLREWTTKDEVKTTGPDPSVGFKQNSDYLFERIDGTWKVAKVYEVVG
jgi:hypothetical protein